MYFYRGYALLYNTMWVVVPHVYIICRIDRNKTCKMVHINLTQLLFVCFMVFHATFNNILVILVEETGENHRPVASHWQTFHIMLYRVLLAMNGFELTTLVVINTECTYNFLGKLVRIVNTVSFQRLHVRYKIAMKAIKNGNFYVEV
jgi:hypothetical protein